MDFWDTTPDVPDFDFNIERQKLIENLDYLFAMSVQEQTLYKKWVELQSDTMQKDYSQLAAHYDMQWKPTDIYNKELTISEIQALDPYVEIVDDDAVAATKWTQIRRMIHTMDFTANPGRNVKINVKDRVSGKLLGQISLASDVTSLGKRDEYIGWTKEDKFVKGKLNNTSIASTIVCTQPLGYNFLGGKLIAMMTTLPEIRDYWKTKYGDVLIAVGTTSLYGINSQYTGIPLFKTLGETKGMISIKPEDKFYDPWHNWLKTERSDWYVKNITNERIRNGESMGVASGPVSGIKQKILTQIFKECGIRSTKYQHGFHRGSYIASIYENGNDFLCSKIDESELIIRPKFAKGQEYINEWWKRHAISRYEKLHTENRIKPEHLYYIDGIGTKWEDFREKYLGEVGR